MSCVPSSENVPIDSIMEILSQEMDRIFPDWGVLIDPPAVPEWTFFESWLSQGRHAGLSYLERTALRRRSLQDGYPGYRTIVLGVLPHDPRAFLSPPGPNIAEIARYAVGEDYHSRFERSFRRVLNELEGKLPSYENPLVKADHGSLLEKSLAQMAGLGRMGKNTLLIHSRLGSFITIGGLLLKTPLRERRGHSKMGDPCGQCVRCLESCPTKAFVGPYHLDAGRCLSYLTIERPGDAGGGLRQKYGENWLFGCDRCQEVCPHNAGIVDQPPSPLQGECGRFVFLEEASEESIRRFRKENGALMRVPVRRLLERLDEISLSHHPSRRENIGDPL